MGVKTDMPRIVENILHVLPDTRTLGIIMGSSPLERFWLKQQQNDLAPFASRVTLLWLDGLTLEQLRERVAALSPHSALLYSSGSSWGPTACPTRMSGPCRPCGP